MAVYVDNLVNHGTNGGDRWLCLCWADELWELHAFGKRIGLQPDWLLINEAAAIPYSCQLSARFRQAALEAGAVERVTIGK